MLTSILEGAPNYCTQVLEKGKVNKTFERTSIGTGPGVGWLVVTDQKNNPKIKEFWLHKKSHFERVQESGCN
jgi:hypothetical protein